MNYLLLLVTNTKILKITPITSNPHYRMDLLSLENQTRFTI